MHRIDGYGSTVGKQFTNGNPGGGVPATVVTDTWLNAVQEEVSNALEAFGIVLDKNNNSQLTGLLLNQIGLTTTSIRTVAASGNVLQTDVVLFVDATAGAVNLTLLSTAAANVRGIRIVKVDNTENAVTLTPQGGQTVLREATIDMTVQDEFLHIIPSGTNWYRIG